MGFPMPARPRFFLAHQRARDSVVAFGFLELGLED